MKDQNIPPDDARDLERAVITKLRADADDIIDRFRDLYALFRGYQAALSKVSYISAQSKHCSECAAIARLLDAIFDGAAVEARQSPRSRAFGQKGRRLSRRGGAHVLSHRE